MKIVSGKSTASYIALSYVWGQPTIGQLQLSKTNFEHLTQSGALLEHWDRIPKVIQQTIKLVREFTILGESRYLWVDSLCIIQNDPNHKIGQISAMGIVYGQALMTVAAVGADSAQQQLLRYEDGHNHEQLLEDLDCIRRHLGVQVGIDHGPFVFHQKSSPRVESREYFRRGWIFQEQYLSRRIMACPRADSPFLYYCRESAIPETPNDLQLHDFGSEFQGLETARRSILEYQRLVNDYTSKDFGHHDDSLRAFAGVLESLKHSSRKQSSIKHCVCGVPCEEIGLGLFWIDEEKESVRALRAPLISTREYHERHWVENIPAQSQLRFPSWSWASREVDEQIRYPLYGGWKSRQSSENSKDQYRWDNENVSCRLRSVAVIEKSKNSQTSVADFPSSSDVEWKSEEFWSQIGIDSFCLLRIEARNMQWPNGIRIEESKCPVTLPYGTRPLAWAEKERGYRNRRHWLSPWTEEERYAYLFCQSLGSESDGNQSLEPGLLLAGRGSNYEGVKQLLEVSDMQSLRVVFLCYDVEGDLTTLIVRPRRAYYQRVGVAVFPKSSEVARQLRETPPSSLVLC
ncbi:HET-domain-containing protein [Amniculicola lignicola CBS 123094]|uniref:HET-domain-containing protein n=1 Tax=Amniculicola lignicola CBS 123094 TaxID=1392246 RepID=A0A6A5X3F9_9PLEO|nr:HET-domain-containing protein [Amniculicola lignicola CBS 123094]